MAGQYSYGTSEDVPQQAANLLGRLIAKAPFAEGNVRTAFIATLTFLNANGYAATVGDDEASAIVRSVVGGKVGPTEAIDKLAAPAAQSLGSTVSLRRLIAHECNHHLAGLRLLADGD